MKINKEHVVKIKVFDFELNKWLIWKEEARLGDCL